MSRIVFFCIPAHGHTNPTLGVVRELALRGHQVRYYSYDAFREKIEQAGAEFVSCDKYDITQQMSRPESGPGAAQRKPGTALQAPDSQDAARIGKDLAFSTKLLVDTTLALDDMVCRDMALFRPDCIVADSMAVWGKAVALKLGIPFVSSTTTFAFNQYSAKIMKQSFREMTNMLLSMPKINRELKRLRDVGYPIKSILDILQNDNQTNTIVYTSPEFQPCADTFSDRYAFVGPSIRPPSFRIKKEKSRLVYISMGTVNNNLPKFYRNCISALGGTDIQVIMSVGSCLDTRKLGSLPENISIFESVDQIAVLSAADAFLSHCGMNSVSESLYYQVPLIMHPLTSEQKGVAARTAQLGAGLLLKKESPAQIRRAVDYMLSNPSYRKNAAKISDSFKRCGGAKSAADKILKACAV